MQLPVFLLILRLLFIVLLYLFLMQVVIAITRDLRKTAAIGDNPDGSRQIALGHLIVVDSGPSTVVQPGMRFDLDQNTTIGRGPTNTIQISDNFISSEHSRLLFRNGVWYVQDAGSVNGTYVNNQPAREPVPARAGDIVRVGYIQFKLTQ
ncbi:FHA domain-containing protein [Dictyobacter kobayashii]|uniref:FHA domain-containing protein n=1 Tax=Dictyobacter kobayashii TaxID=2014872 RepID=A0A402AM62_9CHLR|nr:FHA domain-containing protein [Dictyobacter kobayashii]GCE20227.1 FHA domain-containing protein [Dictyobacter kobayashii]